MSLPSFDEFYVALHGHSPFPWQSRLAELVLRDGWQGLLLDLPTGVGKTTTLEIAVFCLACLPERMPRRTMLVVDRRVVVDQAALSARKLQSSLDAAQQGPLFAIAQRLRDLSAGAEYPSCLSVAVLRGGMPRENDWARSPDLPVVGLSTVDQVGSRILFRGYGLNSRSASIHAGLLGNDTLILLDEVHLARPFQQTLASIEQNFQTSTAALPRRFAVVPMSATAGTVSTRFTFTLDEKDWKDPYLSVRLGTQKLAHLKTVAVAGDEHAKLNKLAEAAAKEAVNLQKGGYPVVGVIVNRVDTARRVAQLLSSDHNVLLITGRMRALDRDQVVENSLIPGAGAGRARTADTARLVVVATQCIEAGADLDFDAMITECAALDALKQRFGRLDRRGELRTSQAVLLMRSDLVGTSKSDAVYGDALSKTWDWLCSKASNEVVDFGTKALANLEKEEAVQSLNSRTQDAPVLMPAHLDGWAQTSPIPSPDSDPALWLHGPTRTQTDVQILWRDLRASSGAELNSEAIFQILDAVRPSSLETVSVPIGAARKWLTGQLAPPIADVLSCPAEDHAEQRFDGPVAYHWTGDSTTSRWVKANEIKPGQILVVDCYRGGLANRSFAPQSTERVSDLGDLAQLRARGVATLRLPPATLEDFSVSSFPIRDAATTDREYQDDLRNWIAQWPAKAPKDYPGKQVEWELTRQYLSKNGRLQVLDSMDCILSAKVPTKNLEAIFTLSDLDTESDSSLFKSEGIGLGTHCADVEKLARGFATNLAFSNEIADDLALAGRLHDLGKADPRFQCWLAGGDEVRMAMNEELLAKSILPMASASQREAARQRAGYPKGYRHELLSVAMAEGGDLGQAHDRDLVLHLVASHHGWCRPFPPLKDDVQDITIEWQGWSASTRHKKACLESGVAERFWKLVERYGWWGLAWLESLVRLADHNASEQRKV